ncbi:MAG: TerB family tellurite resistance protein, partial [Flavobacteriales bacterium]|nr:TerB family tellurite resistance protein [Flavobacteriales bacterium]
MSERILKALMQLFAVVADSDSHGNKSRSIVELFLKQQLSQELVKDYLALYDAYSEHHTSGLHKKEGRKKRNSLSSVKILKICTQINSELTQRQKLIVLIRILEYVNSDDEITKQELEFAITVSETFNIPHDEFQTCIKFVTRGVDNLPEGHNILLINSRPDIGDRVNKHIQVE